MWPAEHYSLLVKKNYQFSLILKNISLLGTFEHIFVYKITLAQGALILIGKLYCVSHCIFPFT